MKTKSKLLLIVLVIIVSLQSFKQGKSSVAEHIPDIPPSFILFEGEIVHRGDKQLYSNWNFNTKRETYPVTPHRLAVRVECKASLMREFITFVWKSGIWNGHGIPL